MTPAEVLAAAADKLDEMSGWATGGPWTVKTYTEAGVPMTEVNGPDAEVARGADWIGGPGPWLKVLDAAYIAAMNPLVGSLLAQVLRRFADACERDSRPTHDQWSRPQRVDDRIPGLTAALDLARLIIGGES